MKKIRDLSVGETATLSLLVKASEIKRTKPPGNKPYLSVDFFDGQDTITGVDWDYGDNATLIKNSIFDVTASVTEWSGNKQLKLLRLRPNAVIDVSVFAPTGGVDIEQYVNAATRLIHDITNTELRETIVARAFNENAALWKTVPSAKGIHHAFVAGNLKHSVDVATKAKVIAETMPGVNIDLCIAGGLLQDFGKLWTYQLNGAVIDMTEEGQMIEHIMIGAIKLESYRTPENSKILDLVQHLISSHHGEIEYGSPTTPMFMEAWIVAAADQLDAKTQVIYELNNKCKPGDKQTEKSFVLNNRQMFTMNYINSIMAQ